MKITDSEIILNDTDKVIKSGNTCVIYQPDGFEQFLSFNKNNKMVLDTSGLIMYLTHELHLTKYDTTALLYKDNEWIDAIAYVQYVYSKYNGYCDNIGRTIKSVINAYCSNPLVRNKIKWNDAKYVEFKNGTYSFTENKLLPKTYDTYQTIKIDCNYVEGATSEILEKALRLILPDRRVRESYLSYLGYIFYKENLQFGKWAVNYGLTHTCKSTFNNIIVGLLNRTNLVAIIDLANIGKQFEAMYYYNKLLLYCDDMADGFIPNTGALKSGATGTIDRLEGKGKDAITASQRSFYKLIANSNKLLRTKEGEFDDAMKRRIIIFPFNEQIDENDTRYIADLDRKLNTEYVVEALVYKSIQAFRKVLTLGKFDETDEMKGYLNKLVNTNRQHELLVQELNFDYIRCEDAYRVFKNACTDRNMKPMSYDWFIDTVKIPIVQNHFMSGKSKLVDGMTIDEALQIDNKADNKDHLEELGFYKRRTTRKGSHIYIIRATD